MRFQARLLLGVCGLALAVPAAVVAAPLGDDEAGYAVVGEQPQPAPHHHKGLFGRRHCVECQRAYAKAHDGVDIPAPPPLDPAGVVVGPGVNGQPGRCATCQGNVVVSGPVMSADPHAPGYAVVGGPGAVANVDAPGYAVVGEGVQGMDPAPIGAFRAGQARSGDPRMAATRPGSAGAGAYDSAVVPTNLPPAQVALAGPGHDRPHIISHLLGLPIIGQGRRARDEQERQKHAAIAYDQPDRSVTELPASMVYGKK